MWFRRQRTSSQPAPKRKRRWLRYSLRSFFVVLTISCLAIGYYVSRAERQARAVQWVERNGGYVDYDFAYDENGQRYFAPSPPGPSWLQDYVGREYRFAVVTVVLNREQIQDISPIASLGQTRHLQLSGTQISDLTPLKELTRTETLSLQMTHVSDLTPLSELVNIEYLALDGTEVDDVTALEHLNRLRELQLAYTRVSDLTPLARLDCLEKLRLRNTPVRDVRPLMDLKHLREIDLQYTNVSQQQVDALKEALPNCTVDFLPKSADLPD